MISLEEIPDNKYNINVSIRENNARIDDLEFFSEAQKLFNEDECKQYFKTKFIKKDDKGKEVKDETTGKYIMYNKFDAIKDKDRDVIIDDNLYPINEKRYEQFIKIIETDYELACKDTANKPLES